MVYETYYIIPISKEDALQGFKYLQNCYPGDYKSEKVEETDTVFASSNNGNKASNYFFQIFRFRTPYRDKGTFEQWITTNSFEKLEQLALQYSKKTSVSELKPHDYTSVLNLRVGTLNQFKPRVAALLYHIYKPKTVLDFCAGWGDRCVAAMAKNVNYIGVDTNLELQPAYTQMVNEYQEKSKSKITMYFQPAETLDFSTLKYDMVFTSPPYFDLEQYANMPKYEGYHDWIEKFLRPVILASYQHLEDQGWMFLNIPSTEDSRKLTKYDILGQVQQILGEPPHKKIQMVLQSRHQGKLFNCEYIYGWKKGSSSPLQQPTIIQEPKSQPTNEVQSLLEQIEKLKAENQALKSLLKTYL